MADGDPENQPTPERAEVTRILSQGDGADSLLPLVYAQLRAVAQQRLAEERRGHTLQATALVHEVYLKLVGPREVAWEGRGHFYAAAAEAMRQVLLDHAKARGRVKRGGGAGRVEFGEAATLGGPGEAGEGPDREDFVALDDAIRRLASRDPRMAEVVRLRYYAGLEIAEVARVLGVSERTVKNDWAFARAWLERELRAGGRGRG